MSRFPQNPWNTNFVRNNNLWPFLLILILLGMLPIFALATDTFKSSPLTATAHFKDEGIIHLDAQTGHLLIKINYNDLFSNLKEFNDTLKAFDEPIFHGAHNIYDKVQTAKIQLEDDITFVTSEYNYEKRAKRSLFGWLGSILGLYNTAKINSINADVQANKEVAQHTVHTVDALNNYAQTNKANIETIHKQIQDAEGLMKFDNLLLKWTHIETHQS